MISKRVSIVAEAADTGGLEQRRVPEAILLSKKERKKDGCIRRDGNKKHTKQSHRNKKTEKTKQKLNYKKNATHHHNNHYHH